MVQPRDPGDDNITQDRKTKTTPVAVAPAPARPAKSTPRSAPKSTTPASTAPKKSTSAAGPAVNGIPRDVYMAIIKAADENGVPRDLALAIAQQESGFNPHSIGDNGTSFGLFQLHKGGELGSMSPDQAYDPYTNASTALRVVGAVYKQHPDWSPGQIAAAAQRPADRVGYANSVNGILQGGTFKAVPVSKATGSAATSAGTGGGATTVDTFTPDPGLSIDTYSFISALAKSEPELANLMKKYAGIDLSSAAAQQRLQADIQNTKWYRNHTSGERQQQVLAAQDPAEYKSKYNAAQQAMKDAAQQLGVNMPPEALTRLTRHYLAEGWNTAQVNNFLLTFGHAGNQPGQLQATTQSLRENASQQMVSLSDASLQKWTQQILTGKMTVDDFNGYLKEQAKSLFPGLASAIDRGVTVQQYVDPYRQHAAQTLEVNPDSIDFMKDPKYSKALFQIDPKTGERTAMSLSDWDNYLRSLPEYAKTSQANAQAAGMARSILSTFGAIAS